MREPAAVSAADRLIFLFSRHGRTALLGLLAIIALLMVRSIIKRSFRAEKPEMRRGPKGTPEEGPHGVMPDKAALEGLPANEVQRRVAQMIEEHPMEAASLLKQWVQRGGR